MSEPLNAAVSTISRSSEDVFPDNNHQGCLSVINHIATSTGNTGTINMAAIDRLISFSGDLKALSLILESNDICRIGIEEISPRDCFFANPSAMFVQ